VHTPAALPPKKKSWLCSPSLSALTTLPPPPHRRRRYARLQVYAPVDGLPSAFHRALYVFISPEGGQLARAGAVRALRCQLPRRNPYYAYDPPAHADACPPALSPAQLAAALARDPWQAARHESPAAAAPAADGAAGAAAAPTGGGAAGGGGITAPALLPELELIVEPEPGPSSEDDSRVEAALAQYRQRTAEEGAYDEEELPASLVDSLEDAVGPEQRHFAAFAARVAKEPSQVLRYCFDEGAAPLCPAAAGVPPAAGVPRCPACAAPRRFEFQVMPQLLNHLEADAADPDAPDWGALAVYSCSASCCGGGGGGGGGGGIEPEGQDGSAYLEEYVWVQPSA
jgi:pre-rRNA-processing protein TSR4